jgi:hypothetical protein
MLASELNYSQLQLALHNAQDAKKWPKLRVQYETLQTRYKVQFSVAGQNAKFPSSINITDGMPYGQSMFYGRIIDGELQMNQHVLRQLAPNRIEALQKLMIAMAKNPLDELKIQGQNYGHCCCCGRELTNPKSIANGIGPICAELFG